MTSSDEEEVPEFPTVEAPVKTPIDDKRRFCSKCGGKARIVSNQYGIQAYCDSCKIDWPIGGPSPVETIGMTPPRGIHKVTTIDPAYAVDYSKIWGK